ncbi:DUF748 domain-containing protein [Cellvibrio sp.]|uniref:DUF748 domain-containing protein n=1 Tax=Cellvibrio sp. TaxID=1965322 RepID=UPI0039648825
MSRYSFPFAIARRFLSIFFKSIIVRVLIVVALLLWGGYYLVLLPWVNRALSDQYFQQTGHHLQHDKIKVELFRCNMGVSHLKDLNNLWQAEGVDINLACAQSFRERRLVINDIKIRQLKTAAVQQENSAWNFDDVLKHQKAVAKKAAKNDQSSRVSVLIKNLSIVNASVHTHVQILKNNPFDLSALNITLTDVDLGASKPSHFTLETTLNNASPILISGQLNVSSLSGSVDINGQNIPFVWFNSFLEPYVRLEVLKGAIEFQNHIELIAGQPQKIKSHGKLIDLKLKPTSMEQDAVRWKSLEWQGAEISLADKTIHVPVLMLNELDGQFIIDKNRKTNVQAMLVPQVEKPNEKTAEGNAEKKWQFAVDKLAINNAAIGFYDQSLVPSFTAIVQNFSGEVVNISSDESTLAIIDLKGNVDGYAPVTLKGKANVFRTAPKLDALLSFKQMDMGAFSPYSAEYAGWKINKGLLSADLNYHYEDGKVLGKNHVVIDHLEFGEKVRGTRVIDIPLRLGLAMLTDANGVAVLDTEISGSPSDPQFKLRDLILRALGNTLKKIVTAPFRFFSSLLNTKEDLGKVQFTAGESQLTNAAREKLALIKEGLAKRPKMRLSVQGTYDQTSDLIALKEEQVKSALQNAGVSSESMQLHDAAWMKAVSAKYSAQLSAINNAEMSAEEQYQALITAENVDPARLTRLAHERAQAVKQYLILQLAVPGEAILLNSEMRCEKAEQCSTSEAIFTLEV